MPAPIRWQYVRLATVGIPDVVACHLFVPLSMDVNVSAVFRIWRTLLFPQMLRPLPSAGPLILIGFLKSPRSAEAHAVEVSGSHNTGGSLLQPL